MTRSRMIGVVILAMTAVPAARSGAQLAVTTQVVATGVPQPTSMVFLSPTSALVASRRAGSLMRLDVATGRLTPIRGLPANLHEADAGLHAVALDSEYERSGVIFLAYSEGVPERSTLALARGRLVGDSLRDVERIFVADAYAEDMTHYGGQVIVDGEYVFLTIGDRDHSDRAQDRRNHTGTIVRLRRDGSTPADNPFVGDSLVRPEIWSYGHRNPQGLTIRPETGELWAHEHGPRGGDELNVIERGGNYGWPVVSYGFQYDGGPIGRGVVQEPGFEPPVWVWVPSIAPSSMVFYTGSEIPEWRGDLLIGAMGRRHLNRVRLRDHDVVLEERLLLREVGRIRLVTQGPDGRVYIGNDDGQILRVIRRR